MKNQEIKKLSDKELNEALARLRDEVRTLRFKLASGDLKKVRSIRVARKTIARLLTQQASRKRVAAPSTTAQN